MKLRELFQGTKLISISGEGNPEITGVVFDSREVKRGNLFVALKGERFDGNEYISDAVSNGAVAILSEQPLPADSNALWLRSANSRITLAQVARRWFGSPDEELVLVGITGTNGKTSVAHILQAVLGRCLGPCGRIGTISHNTGAREIPAPLTTPEATHIHNLLREMRDSGCRSAVMEASSHAIDRERVRGLEFDVVVFTNLSRDHLDYHGSLENYYRVKRRLFQPEGSSKPVAVINVEDEWGRRLIKDTQLQTFTFGLTEDADVRGSAIEVNLDGTRMKISTPQGDYSVSSNLIGHPNAANLLAAGAVAYALGLDSKKVAAAMQEVPTVRGRLEKIESQAPFGVIVDYAHTDAALERLLLTAKELVGASGGTGRVIVVFGCGGDRDRGKRPLMGRHAVQLSDMAILTSDNPRSEDPLEIIREVEEGMNEVSGHRAEHHTLPDRREAIRFAISVAGYGDLVLIAGKGHEDYQIVGDKRLSFDDRQEALEAIAEL